MKKLIFNSILIFFLLTTVYNYSAYSCGQALFNHKQINDSTISFTDLSETGLGLNIIGWQWTFGDGDTSDLQHPSHIYDTGGIYEVCLIIKGKKIFKGANICYDTVCTQVVFQEDTCIADFLLYEPLGVGGFENTFKFFDLSSGNDSLVSWQWEFGDDSISNLQHPSHTYDTTGVFTVCLEATTNSGCKAKKCIVIDSLGERNGLLCASLTRFNFFYKTYHKYEVELVAKGTGSSGACIEYLKWDFGDGTADSAITDVIHTYSNTEVDSYWVCLSRRTFGANPEQLFCGWVILPDCKPVFDYDASGLLVDFDAHIIDAASWEWDFGDGGNNSYEEEPSHYYADTGWYEVCLEVITEYDLCKDNYCKNIHITYDTVISGYQTNSYSINGIDIYPNPSNGSIRISVNNNEKLTNIMIYNTLGQKVKAINMDLSVSKIHLVDLSELSEGMYTVHLELEGKRSSVHKLFINH